jgi:hypothetical protein
MRRHCLRNQVRWAYATAYMALAISLFAFIAAGSAGYRSMRAETALESAQTTIAKRGDRLPSCMEIHP